MKSQPYSAAEAWHILRNEQPPAWVLEHVEAVRALAVAMAERCDADVALVEVGAILHDLGRAQTQDTMHTILGVERAMELGLPEPVIRIIARHTGAGIDEASRQTLGWPEGTYEPASLEERIVCHADNLHSGPNRLTLAQVLEKYQSKSLPEAGQKIASMHADLCQLLGVDLDSFNVA